MGTPVHQEMEMERSKLLQPVTTVNTIPGRTSQGYQTLDVLLSKRRLITEGSPANGHYS